jgi:N-acetylmuramoyl-L-alanine amidase
MNNKIILSILLISISSLAMGFEKITSVRLFDTDNATRIIFNTSSLTPVKTFSLTNPHRLVFDFKNARLEAHLNPSSLPLHIKNIREGHPNATTLRIVMDTDTSFTIKKVPQLNPSQMVTDIYFNRAQVKAMPVPIPVKPFVVVIDAGHGGKDTGAIGFYKTREKDVVLSIATQLAYLINQQPHMRAVLTRKGDYFVPLANRLVLARKGEADLFIAIHADSYFNTRASGASVFALSQRGATTVAARWLSDSDNHSELGGVELNRLNDQSVLLRSVLIDMAQTATIRDSLRLGNVILDQLDNMTKLHGSGVEQAPFMVLKSPDIPSILVETGFISNGAEELRLRDRFYQHKLALALLDGIRLYQKKYISGVQ